LLLPFCFKHFLLASSSSQAKEEKEKKNHRKEKNAKKGRSLPSSSQSALSFLVLAFGLMFLSFRFKRFFLGIFFFSNIKKEKNTKRKMQRKEGAYLSSFAFAFVISALLAFSSPHSFNVELSIFLKPCVSCLLEVLCYSSSGALRVQ
jgi:flagellar biosynthesis protein FlhB